MAYGDQAKVFPEGNIPLALDGVGKLLMKICNLLAGGTINTADLTGLATEPKQDDAITQLTALNTAIGTTTDAGTASTVIGLLKAIKANTATP